MNKCICSKSQPIQTIMCTKCHCLQHTYCYHVPQDVVGFLCIQCRIKEYLPHYCNFEFICNEQCIKSRNTHYVTLKFTSDQMLKVNDCNAMLYAFVCTCSDSTKIAPVAPSVSLCLITFNQLKFDFNAGKFMARFKGLIGNVEKWKLCYNTPGDYILSVFIVNFFSSKKSKFQEIIQNIPTLPRDTEITNIRLFRKNSGSSDISPLTPITKSIIRCPVRGNKCMHLSCLDAYEYISWCLYHSDWLCPFCKKTVFAGDLIQDSYVNEMLKQYEEKAKGTSKELVIRINENGTYKIMTIEEASLSTGLPQLKPPITQPNTEKKAEQAKQVPIESYSVPSIDIKSQQLAQKQIMLNSIIKEGIIDINNSQPTITQIVYRLTIPPIYKSGEDITLRLSDYIKHIYELSDNTKSIPSKSITLDEVIGNISAATEKMDEGNTLLYSLLLANHYAVIISIAFNNMSIAYVFGTIVGRLADASNCLLKLYNMVFILYPHITLPTNRTNTLFEKDMNDYYEEMVYFHQSSFMQIRNRDSIVLILKNLYSIPAGTYDYIEKSLLQYWELHFLRKALQYTYERLRILQLIDPTSIIFNQVKEYYGATNDC